MMNKLSYKKFRTLIGTLFMILTTFISSCEKEDPKALYETYQNEENETRKTSANLERKKATGFFKVNTRINMVEGKPVNCQEFVPEVMQVTLLDGLGDSFTLQSPVNYKAGLFVTDSISLLPGDYTIVSANLTLKAGLLLYGTLNDSLSISIKAAEHEMKQVGIPMACLGEPKVRGLYIYHNQPGTDCANELTIIEHRAGAEIVRLVKKQGFTGGSFTFPYTIEADSISVRQKQNDIEISGFTFNPENHPQGSLNEVIFFDLGCD